MDMREPTIWDRLGVAAVSMLLAAFVISVAAPVIANASTSDTAKRDDKASQVTAVEDEEDDDLLRDNTANGSRKGDQTGKTTKGDKSDKTGKNTGNGKDTRTGNSGATGQDTGQNTGGGTGGTSSRD